MDESLRALLEDDGRARTVGERLDDAGRQLAGRHPVTSAIAGRSAPALRRAGQLNGLFAGRFERDESPAGTGSELMTGGRGTAWRTPGASARPAAAPVAWPRPESESPTPAPPPASARHEPRHSSPAPPESGRPDAESPGRPLPLDVRARLRDIAGPGVDAEQARPTQGSRPGRP